MSGHSILSVPISVCMYPCQKYRRIACVIITIPTASWMDTGSRLYRVKLFTFGPASIVQFRRRLPALSTIGFICFYCSHSDLPLLSNSDCGCWPCPPLDSYSGAPYSAACHRRYDCIHPHYYDHFTERAADSTAD
jgi:hypothetical protein